MKPSREYIDMVNRQQEALFKMDSLKERYEKEIDNDNEILLNEAKILIETTRKELRLSIVAHSILFVLTMLTAFYIINFH